LEQSSLKQSLLEILRVEPDTEYLDLSDQNITSIEKDLEPFLSQFKFLKELNLEDNSLKSLPLNLSAILPKMEIINLNGNDFDDFN
jgi:Leucine-rich repeat (LRR) protein